MFDSLFSGSPNARLFIPDHAERAEGRLLFTRQARS